MAENYASHRPPCPPIPDDPASITDTRQASACRIFMDAMVRYNTTKRAELERGWNRARNYDAARQWLQPLRGAGGDRLWYTWEPLRSTGKGDVFPRPVRNVFSAKIQDETSRLVGVGSKPYVRVEDPAAEDGALLAKRVLSSRNEDTGWDRQNRLGCYHAVMFGQWIEMAEWQISRLKVAPYPVLSATRCRECGFALAKRDVGALEASSLNAGVNPGAVHQIIDGGAIRWQAMGCPKCGADLEDWTDDDPMPQERYKIGRREDHLDALGRPLWQDIPLGDDVTSVVSPYCAFPGNQGVGYQTDEEMEEIAIRTIESIPYIQEHYHNSEGLSPSGEWEVYRHHPVITGYWGLAYGIEGVWANHLPLDRYYGKPSMEFPRGRAIVMAGRRLLYDGALLIEGTDIPVADVRWAQWEIREGEIWGKPLAEDLISSQDNINSTLSQDMDRRQKYTTPKVILHEGMNLDFAGGANSPYAGDIWKLNTRGIPPELAARFPFLFGHQAASENNSTQIQQEIEFLDEMSGIRAADTGNVQGVEFNYAALMLAATKSAERRKPRIQGFRELKRRIWGLRLRYCSAFYHEDRLIHYRDDADKEQVQQIRGLALKGQTSVALEDEPLVDSGVAVRASIQQALTMGTLRTSQNGGSYAADRRINRAMGVPEELNEDRNQQDEGAEAEWNRWWGDEDLEPAIDEVNDDHLTHLQRHNLSWSSKKGRQYQEELAASGIPWTRVLLATWEWQRLLGELEQMVTMARSMPPPEKVAPEELARMGYPPQEIERISLQFATLRQAVDGVPAPIELKVHHVLTRLIRAYKITLAPSPETAGASRTLDKLVRFHAHRLGHWLILKGAASGAGAPAQMAAPPPGPGPAAPGPEAGGAPPPAPGPGPMAPQDAAA